MYVVTNREVVEGVSGLDQFGKRPNRLGPNELRFAEVRKAGSGWSVQFLDDRLSDSEVQFLIDEHKLPLDPTNPFYASLKVACDIARRARAKKTHVVLYVHGFNNDMKDVVSQAHGLSKRYGVEVIPFSWPANGGGAISGTASYKSDKRDARASVGALDRTLKKLHQYLTLITEANRCKCWSQASDRHPENPEARDALYAHLLEKDCPFTVNLLLHSMGNYLFKQMMKSTASEGGALMFDNVVLAAADTNNVDHDLWVDEIRCRRRCYVTINENDYALAASRAKMGSEQLARLGHYVRNLNSNKAYYINFTGAPWVKRSHSYFGEPADKNNSVYGFFEKAFCGEIAEEGLRYRSSGNYFQVD